MKSTSVIIYDWNVPPRFHATQNHPLPRRLQGKWSCGVLFQHGKKCDINRPIVFESRRSLWKLSGATFSTKQSSVAMIQDGSREGRRKTDWLSSTINQSEEETASSGKHA